MKAPFNLEAGTFYELGGGFYLPTQDVLHRSELVVANRLTVTCMFDVSLINYQDQTAGFFFKTRFEVQNHGGYLITFLQNKRQATEVEVLIKTEDLVLYNYPNRGSLAISPRVSDLVATVFDEQ